MAAKFVPLTLNLIEEGQFLADLDAALAEAQRKLIEFVELEGAKAKKAKSVLKIAIALTAADVENAAYTIATEIKTTYPGRLNQVSLAVQEYTDDQQPALFVRASGSDEDSPRQGKLFTRHDLADDRADRPLPPGAGEA